MHVVVVVVANVNDDELTLLYLSGVSIVLVLKWSLDHTND